MNYKYFKILSMAGILAIASPIFGAPLQINDQITEVDYKIINDRTLIEMYELVDILKARVSHNKDESIVTITDNNTTITLWLKDGLVSITKKNSGTPAVMFPFECVVEGEKIFLPLRFIGENMGMKILFKNGIPSIQFSKQTVILYDFEKDDNGFYPIFADYHDDSNDFNSYKMNAKYSVIPVTGKESKGLYITGINTSDDLFMGYVKKIEGLEPNKEYTFDIKFKLATNQENGMVGVGGSPGEAVFVKCGIVNVEPKVSLNEETNIYRMNIDIGSQINDGKDMKVVGNISKPIESTILGFDYKPFETTITMTTDSDGSVYLIIGTDSGFEGFTEYYLDDIEISF